MLILPLIAVSSLYVQANTDTAVCTQKCRQALEFF